MKRILWLALALLLLPACAGRAVPAPTPEPTAPATAPASPALTASPSPSPTPAPTPEPSPTPEPRWVHGDETVSYLVLQKDLPGAEALCIWLLGEGQELIQDFGTDRLGEPMFTLASGLRRSDETVVLASDETRYITLAADQRLLDSGLLEALLPRFEWGYGYRVEILSAPGPTAAELARDADIAILGGREAEALRREGLFRSYWPLASTDYVREDVTSAPVPAAPEEGES